MSVVAEVPTGEADGHTEVQTEAHEAHRGVL